MGADFSGYATKAGLKCSDGRTIMPHAFKAQDGTKVPLVWQHGHNDAGNVLGHAILENREDGVYAYGYFNGTDQGKSAKVLVQHGDITALSIYANKLVEKSKQVLHGAIREVSLVLSGANPGAFIDNITISHSDGDDELLDDEAVIYTGLSLEHEDMDQVEEVEEELELVHKDQTVQDVYDSLSEEQKNVVHYMIGVAVENAGAAHSDTDEDDLSHQEGNEMSRNVFEQTAGPKSEKLSHAEVQSIVASAVKGGSLKEAVEEYALKHGIEDIDILFPDARALSNTPEWDKRRTEWVAGVLNGVSKSPFSRIKTMSANITHDEARAKGYIKGTLKKEEFFGLMKRTTGPTTVYKKQKLDRDDILDITDLDVVAWMKAEMRLMLDEEIARAILIGDGREVDDEDKIKDPAGATDGLGIRSILNENELYATTITVNLDDANSRPSEAADAIIGAMSFYKGSGSPTFFTTTAMLNKFLLEREPVTNRRVYGGKGELANDLGVANIVTVEVMEGAAYDDLVGIIVNLSDYVAGADKGGDVTMFDDFDIDYNQYKYLIETRLSGALKKIKSAIIVRKTAGTNVAVAPAAPTFDPETGALTITNQTGVVYKHGATVVNAAGSPYDVPAGQTWTIDATPAAGYYFATSENDAWDFTADA